MGYFLAYLNISNFLVQASSLTVVTPSMLLSGLPHAYDCLEQWSLRRWSRDVDQLHTITVHHFIYRHAERQPQRQPQRQQTTTMMTSYCRRRLGSWLCLSSTTFFHKLFLYSLVDMSVACVCIARESCFNRCRMFVLVDCRLQIVHSPDGGEAIDFFMSHSWRPMISRKT